MALCFKIASQIVFLHYTILSEYMVRIQMRITNPHVDVSISSNRENLYIISMRKNSRNFGYYLLMLGALVVFPIASTASSDAQEFASMWLYLAVMVLLCAEISPYHRISEKSKC